MGVSRRVQLNMKVSGYSFDHERPLTLHPSCPPRSTLSHPSSCPPHAISVWSRQRDVVHQLLLLCARLISAVVYASVIRFSGFGLVREEVNRGIGGI